MLGAVPRRPCLRTSLWSQNFLTLSIALLLVTSLLGTVAARSYPGPPIAVAYPLEHLTVESTQWSKTRVQYNSRLNLTFSLVSLLDHGNARQDGQGDEVVVRLALRPNEDLFHSDTVTVQQLDGDKVTEECLDRTAFRIFKGDALIKGRGLDKWQKVGDARLACLRDGSDPLFEGVFDLLGDHYHIFPREKYEQFRQFRDFQAAGSSAMIFWRDSDQEVQRYEKLFQEQLEVGDGFSEPFVNVHGSLPRLVGRSVGTDGISNSTMCGIDRLYHATLNKRAFSSMPGFSANDKPLVDTIGSAEGCPKVRMVAHIGVAIDCSYRQKFDNENAVRQHVLNTVNKASLVFERSLNIVLALSKLVISGQNCPVTTSSVVPWNAVCDKQGTINDQLNKFSVWRGTRQGDSVALWTLMTGCQSSQTREVGVAWLGRLCDDKSTPVVEGSASGTNVVQNSRDDWRVMAHEIGHGFGAVHDCDTAACSLTSMSEEAKRCCPLSKGSCDAGARYIMNPYSTDTATDFSPCTVGNICSALGSNAVSSKCLVSNRDINLVSAPECGNGIVEEGEDCDCGGVDGCRDDPCCDPHTCKFTAGSVCDDKFEVCCQKCQHAPKSLLCRNSQNAICDPPEYCTGNSSTCPNSRTVPDGTDCGDGLQCASGQCTSRDLQCRNIFKGSTGACDTGDCIVTCRAPQSLGYPRNFCITNNQNYQDGTPCSGSGRCRSGVCVRGSAGQQIANWFRRNRTLTIIIGCLIGAFIVSVLACCLFKRRRSKRTSQKTSSSQPAIELTTRGAPPSSVRYPPAVAGARISPQHGWTNQYPPYRG